jgi:hypothetical protein
MFNSTLAIQESTLGRSGKDGEAPSGNLVKSGGAVDITKLLSLLCRCNKALHVAAIFLLAGCGEDGQSRVIDLVPKNSLIFQLFMCCAQTQNVV